MTAAINRNASGAWAREEGTAVEVRDYSPNRRAVLVAMPPDAKLARKAGRDCWIPAGWIDIGKTEVPC